MTNLKVASFVLFGFLFILVKCEPQPQNQHKIEPLVVVHGGAHTVEEKSMQSKLQGVRDAAIIGYEALEKTGNVLDAVQEAIYSMELNGEFNAGYGSALTVNGEVEMDASIQNGADLNSGSVATVRDILSPISLARLVMEKSKYAFFGGDGAMNFARLNNVTILPAGALVTQSAKNYLEKFEKDLYDKKIGTVGCVAIDAFGNIAAGTSTGGYAGKPSGRIGDSPLIGAGTIADNRFVGVSSSGRGEDFIRYNVAAKILASIQYEGLSTQQAIEKIMNEMKIRYGEDAGVIAIDAKGDPGVYSISSHFAWAYLRGKELHSGLLPTDHYVQTIN